MSDPQQQSKRPAHEGLPDISPKQLDFGLRDRAWSLFLAHVAGGGGDLINATSRLEECEKIARRFFVIDGGRK